MAKRQIQDIRGLVWDVWDVVPRDVLGSAYDRRSSDRVPDGAESPQLLLLPELEHGWLCFQSGAERRRLAPIPPSWFEFSEVSLRALLDAAQPVSSTAPTRQPASAAE